MAGVERDRFASSFGGGGTVYNLSILHLALIQRRLFG